MLRIAAVGLGDIAQKAYLPIICNHPEITPVFCTRNADTLNVLSKKYRVSETYNNLANLIQSKPDAAMVHSTTESHFEIVESLLKNHIPVFIDKPISYHLNESNKLLKLAESQTLPLFVGFNRRYAPLITSINESKATHFRLQKNRANITANARTFILDDFIHVIDTLLHLGQGKKVEDLQVQSNWLNDELAALHVQWIAGNTSFHGSMNRICGITEECLEVFGQLQKWKIENLSQGCHYQNGESFEVGFNDWEHTLYKRGFVQMIENFISQVKTNKVESSYIQTLVDTHTLCEKIVETCMLQYEHQKSY